MQQEGDGRVDKRRTMDGRRGVRKVAFAGALAVFGVVAIMALAAPLAAAASSVTQVAPYTGATKMETRQMGAVGFGAVASAALPPSFSLATGAASTQAFVQVLGVGAAQGKASLASYQARMGISAMAFTVPANQAYTFVATWTVSYALDLQVHHAFPVQGKMTATGDVYLVALLIDTSAGKLIQGSGTLTVIAHLSVATGQLFSTKMAATYTAGVTGAPLVANHVYQFVAFIGVRLTAVAAPGAIAGETARSSIGLFGTQLTSLTVS